MKFIWKKQDFFLTNYRLIIMEILTNASNKIDYKKL